MVKGLPLDSRIDPLDDQILHLADLADLYGRVILCVHGDHFDAQLGRIALYAQFDLVEKVCLQLWNGQPIVRNAFGRCASRNAFSVSFMDVSSLVVMVQLVVLELISP